MEIIEVLIEYASGMTLTDRATYSDELDQVYLSERLRAVISEFGMTEAPPAVSATIGGVSVQLEARVDGSYSVVEGRVALRNSGFMWTLIQPFAEPTKDQRHQFGRFCHTLAAAAFLGAVGLWHATTEWTPAIVQQEAGLIVSFVITFIRGMVSMKGE